MKELLVAPDDRTVLIGMNPDPSVGMSAKNSTFTVAPSPPGAPVGGLTKDSPPAVTEAVIRIGTPVCRVPVSGFVQLVVPSHCIDEPVNDVNDIV